MPLKNIIRKLKRCLFLQVVQSLLKIILKDLKNNCSKIKRRDLFLVKLFIFAFLVCTSHKEPIQLTKFDCLYLKKYF